MWESVSQSSRYLSIAIFAKLSSGKEKENARHVERVYRGYWFTGYDLHINLPDKLRNKYPDMYNAVIDARSRLRSHDSHEFESRNDKDPCWLRVGRLV